MSQSMLHAGDMLYFINGHVTGTKPWLLPPHVVFKASMVVWPDMVTRSKPWICQVMRWGHVNPVRELVWWGMVGPHVHLRLH